MGRNCLSNPKRQRLHHQSWVSSSIIPSQWRHNGRDGVSNHQPHDCLLNRLSRRRSMKTLKLRVTSLCAGDSPVTGEFPAQTTSNAENVSIWWRHHVLPYACDFYSILCIQIAKVILKYQFVGTWWILYRNKWKKTCSAHTIPCLMICGLSQYKDASLTV